MNLINNKILLNKIKINLIIIFKKNQRNINYKIKKNRNNRNKYQLKHRIIISFRISNKNKIGQILKNIDLKQIMMMNNVKVLLNILKINNKDN